MSVGTDAAEKQVYSAETFDGCLVGCALCFEVGSVAVENVDVGGRYVDVVKQVAVHEGVIAFGVVLGKSDILVHVECHYVLKRYTSLFACLYKLFVHADGRTSGRESENKRMLRCRTRFVDTLDYMFGCGT